MTRLGINQNPGYRRIAAIGILMLILTRQIASGQTFSVEILVRSGDLSQTLIIGLDPDATPGYDPPFDRFAPPPPPSGNFDARIRNGAEDYFTDIRSPDSLQTFRLLYSRGPSGQPIHLSWQIRITDSSAGPESYRGSLTDLFQGTYGPIDLEETGELDTSIRPDLIGSGIRIMLVKEPNSGVSSPKQHDGVLLLPNYPNPFNPGTTILFELSRPSRVVLTVFNARGERVKTLREGFLEAGRHGFPFDGSALTGGIYYYRLKTDRCIATRPMILLK